MSSTFVDLKNYFMNDIPHQLGLNYPEANGIIAGMIIDLEDKNRTFLPGTMPADKRAEFAIPTFGGFKGERNAMAKDAFDKMVRKYKLFAEIIILKHRLSSHATDEIEASKIKDQLSTAQEIVALEGITFNEKEQDLIGSAMGFWGPGVIEDV